LFVSLLGLTPGLPVVFGVPEQLSNFEPPGVIFVVADADAPVFADTEAEADWDAALFDGELLEACSSLLPRLFAVSLLFTLSSLFADADADVDAEVDADVEDDSSAFFA
jgi:hypothetical protein